MQLGTLRLDPGSQLVHAVRPCQLLDRAISADFQIHDYSHKNIVISVQKNAPIVSLRVDAAFLDTKDITSLLAELEAEPIVCPFEEWLAKTLRTGRQPPPFPDPPLPNHPG